MASDSQASNPCPVVFCGTPTLSVGFDTFLSNAQKIPSIAAQHILILGQAAEKLKEIDHGVVILLLANKNDLVTVLNALVTLKKRIDQGVVRVVVYNLMNHDKVAQVLKQKGANESVVEGLTQKALVHKLQKHIQIVLTKHKSARQSRSGEVTLKSGKGQGKARSHAVKGTLKFVAAVEHENDCWLLKNKKDFKFVRGMWLGEMIGPGPSAGSWSEVSGQAEKGRTVFQWAPRGVGGQDPFVPGKGSWFYSGRQPEFVWKTNRWRFIGEAPALFFKPGDGGPTVFRFRCPTAGSLEVGLNSAAAKAKLKDITATFAQDKRFRDEKKKEQPAGDLVLTPEERAARGDLGDPAPDEDLLDWGGDLDGGEEEAPGDWNDEIGDEDEEAPEWGGLDTGRGNKFDGGRGLGQGGGKKGYKYDEDEDLGDSDGDLGFATGADAFERIQLEITMSRPDEPGNPTVGEVSLLERQEGDILFDVPARGYAPGENLGFKVLLRVKGERRDLELKGVLKATTEAEGREIILVAVEEGSRAHLGEIQKVFELRQEELLRFLREAKGNG